VEQLVTVQPVAINNHGHKIHKTTHIYDKSWANSDMPLFRGRPLHHLDTSRTSVQFMEINYMQIGLSIADLTVV
jgi:hypothetical protein